MTDNFEKALKTISQDADFVGGIVSGLKKEWQRRKMLEFIEYGKSINDIPTRSELVALMLALRKKDAGDGT